MPYFTRQPYAATSVAAEPRAAVQPTDFVAMAREVLASDSPPRVEGPFGPRRPLAPGKAGSLVLDLALDDDGAPMSLGLAPGPLAGPAATIPPEALRVVPSALMLAPGKPATVTVTISVPPGTAPGRYRGALAVTGTEPLAIPIEVEVG